MSIRLVTLQLLLAFAMANARNDAPPSSDRTWSPPGLPNYERELANYRSNEVQGGSRVSINARKVYNLAELIDVAERNNPETQVAWERARQAAAAVGLSESAYYPFLVASAAAGYDRAFIPFPTLAVNQKKLLTNPSLNDVKITGGGSLVTESRVYRAELNAKWLLLDFGERSAVVATAREQLMMANVGFNATHQKIVFQVTDRFYELGTARQKVLMTRSSLEAAQTVEQAVQARVDNGLATTPELLQAQQQSAQAEFDVEFGDNKPTFGAFLTASVPIFDAFQTSRTAESRAPASSFSAPRNSAPAMSILWRRAKPSKIGTLAVRKAPKVGLLSPKYFDPAMLTSSSVSLTCASIATFG